MNKAVFLDRDGVINNNNDHYYVADPANFTFNEGAIEFIKECNAKGYKIIVITNQGGVARGFCTENDVHNVHNYMLSELTLHNAHIDEIYYCPHHDDVEKCICRKPDSLMVEKGIARFNIDTEKAILFGDNATDVMAGEKAGIKGIQIRANEDLRNYLHLLP